MQRGRCRRDGVEDDGNDGGTELAMVKTMKVGLPAAPALPLDRVGFRNVGEGAGGTANLVLCARPFTPF